MTAIDTDIREVQKMFDVNVFGPMRMVRDFHPLLVKGQGTIVNIGSVGGIVPYMYGCMWNEAHISLVECLQKRGPVLHTNQAIHSVLQRH